MIPGKIYLVEGYNDVNSLLICSTNSSDQNGKRPEYVMAPIAKRFDVEKPLKSGNYLVSNHVPEPIWRRIDYYHADTNEWDTGSPYWFAEIILPTIQDVK